MGYIGQRFSERAKEAYNNFELPLSHWTKENIIESLNAQRKDLDFSKLTKQELIDNFLRQTSWHHTGKFYNQTFFYEVKDIEALEQSDIDFIKQERKTKKKEPQQENLFITAIVEFDYWTGYSGRKRKHKAREIVKYRSNDKLISTTKGTKRLSSLNIMRKIEQKTKFADKSKLEKYL